MRSLRGLLPQVGARRVWGPDGTPIWEFRFTSRREVPVALIESTEQFIESTEQFIDQPIGPRIDQPIGTPDVMAAESVTAPQPGGESDPDRRAGGSAGSLARTLVTSRGLKVGSDTLHIVEFHHRITEPEIDLGERLERTDLAVALVELAADPENEALHRRVVGRLALAHKWFERAPALDVSSALVTGEGLGYLVDGVYVWRARGGSNVFTYVVAPGPAVKDLLKADPALARALIRAACPNPHDALGDLDDSLREAIGRLRATAQAQRVRVADSRGAEVVLEVDPDPVLLRRLEQGPVGERNRTKSLSERALSAELATLARAVGAASVRPVPTSAQTLRSTGRSREAG